MKNATDNSPTLTASGEGLARLIQEAGKPRRSRKWLVLILLIVFSGSGWLWLGKEVQDGQQGTSFVTEPLKRGDLSLDITVTGNLEPTNEVTVGSELSGIVLEVYKDTNDHVTLGEPLVKLDTSKLEAQTESSRATLNSAKAKVTLARATLKESQASLARLQNLEEISLGKAVSPADLDTAIASAERAQADVLSAEASVGEAEAQLRINERDLEKAVIKSPIDGIVLTRNIEPGQTVAASFTAPELFVIAEKLEHMKLIVAVAEADIGHVSSGQNASFTVDAWPDRVYHAKVTKVFYGSSVTDNVVTYQAELEVGNDDLTLRPGMTATADIKAAEAKGQFIVQNEALRFNPAEALSNPGKGAKSERSFVQSLMPGPPRNTAKSKGNTSTPSAAAKAGNYRVWVLDAGTPRPVSVKLGITDERRTVISGEGLSENLAIILRTETAVPR